MAARKPARIVEYADRIAVVANNTGREHVFDRDVRARLEGVGWNENGPGYLQGRVDGKMMFAHHLVVGRPGPGFEVDHINRVPSDNRRANLRFVPRSKNRVNSGRRSDNRTGFKGVCFDKGKGKFMAYVTKDRKAMFIGRFDAAEEAARAYDRKAVELFGEQYGCTNAKLGLLLEPERRRGDVA